VLDFDDIDGAAKRSIILPRRGAGLHAMIASAGVEDVREPQPYRWDGRRRGRTPFVLLQHTLEGEGELTFESSAPRPVGPGRTMLLRFPHEHVYRRPRRKRWRFFFLCLHGREVMRLWIDALTRLGPVVDLSDNHPLLTRAAAVCREVIDGTIDSPFRASSAAYDVTMALQDHAATGGRGDESMTPPAIHRAMQAVATRFTESLDVDALAALAGMSRYHFTRRYREATGESPGEALHRRRLEHAVGLLQTTGLPIGKVAVQAGFHDANHLGKALRRRLGASPSEVRRAGPMTG